MMMIGIDIYVKLIVFIYLVKAPGLSSSSLFEPGGRFVKHRERSRFDTLPTQGHKLRLRQPALLLQTKALRPLSART